MPACARPGVYVPRQTHDCDASVLVCRHLAGFLELLEESAHGPLPEFVKAERHARRNRRVRGQEAHGLAELLEDAIGDQAMEVDV